MLRLSSYIGDPSRDGGTVEERLITRQEDSQSFIWYLFRVYAIQPIHVKWNGRCDHGHKNRILDTASFSNEFSVEFHALQNYGNGSEKWNANGL